MAETYNLKSNILKATHAKSVASRDRFDADTRSTRIFSMPILT